QLAKNFPDAAGDTADYSAWQPQKVEKSVYAYNGGCSIIAIAQSEYKKGAMIATRKAFGQSLALLGDTCDSVISLDAEVKNSTYAELFEAVHPDRFFQCFVAEQNMIGMGIGFERRGKTPFISTFSSFFSRAHDQIRMASIGS